MRNKILFAFLFLLSFTLISSIVPAQTIKVTPAKTTYRRPKPISEYKKTFTVIRPKVKGVTAALGKKIESALSYEKNFETFNVREEIRDIQWLSEASYKVDYNKKGILGVTLWVEGSGAYPDGSSKPVIVNVKTGNRVTPPDVFTNLNGLAAKINVMQQAEIKQAIIDIKKENPEEENPANLFENANFTAADLKEFSVDDKGVTFWYDYGFPHVIQALQPEGRYSFSWAQLKPHIKSGGLFAQFVR